MQSLPAGLADMEAAVRRLASSSEVQGDAPVQQASPSDPGCGALWQDKDQGAPDDPDSPAAAAIRASALAGVVGGLLRATPDELPPPPPPDAPPFRASTAAPSAGELRPPPPVAPPFPASATAPTTDELPALPPDAPPFPASTTAPPAPAQEPVQLSVGSADEPHVAAMAALIAGPVQEASQAGSTPRSKEAVDAPLLDAMGAEEDEPLGCAVIVEDKSCAVELSTAGGFCGEADGDAFHQDRSAFNDKLANARDAISRTRTAAVGGCDGVLLAYCAVLRRCPKLVISLYLVGVVLLLVCLRRDLALETDIGAFIQADGAAMRNEQAFMTAFSEKEDIDAGRRLQEVWSHFDDMPEDGFVDGLGRSVDFDGGEARDFPSSVRRLKVEALYFVKTLTFVYVARQGDALDRKVLSDIGSFEKKLRGLTQFEHLCTTHSVSPMLKHSCLPGETLLAYAQPTWQNATSLGRAKLQFNGRGVEVLDAHALLTLLQSLDTGKAAPYVDPARFFPREFDLDEAVRAFGREETYPPPKALRSVFKFNLGVGGAGVSLAEIRSSLGKRKQDFEKMVTDAIYPFLQGDLSDYQHIRIYFSGDSISSYEITSTLFNDLKYAIGSFLFVTLYMWVHTRSIVLSIASLLIILTSVPVAFVLAPAEKTTIASFMSFFLIVGIGSDVVFVFVDFWNQSAQQKGSGRDMDARLAYTILHAGKGCLATSLTTAVSFFANLASVLKPLREFGLFMGLCVTSAYLLVLFFLPPVFALRERRRLRIQHRTVDISAGEVSALTVKQAGNRRCFRGACRSDHSRPSKSLLLLAYWISACPITILLCSLILIISFIVGVAVNAEVDTGFPDIFPSDHNQVAGREARTLFAAVAAAPEAVGPVTAGDICDPTDSSPMPCLFHWCSKALHQAVPPDATTGSCWRSPMRTGRDAEQQHGMTVDRCSSVSVSTRVAIAEPPALTDWNNMFTAAVSSITPNTSTRVVTLRGSFVRKGSLVMESWSAGGLFPESFFQAPEVMSYPASLSARSSLSCSVDVMCFFGQEYCAFPGWSDLGKFSLGGRRLSSGTRSLSFVAPTVAKNKQIDIRIVFGILPQPSSQLVGPVAEYYRFDPSFEPDNPWAQRAIMAMCSEKAAAFRLVREKCWIRSFKTHLAVRGKRFPSRNFHQDVVQWYRAFPADGQALLWIIDYKMVACMVQFWVDVPHDMPASRIVKYRQLWDDLLSASNRRASVSANRAWHSASAWVRAEAEVAIIQSTADTIMLSAGCGGAGMLLFTLDPWLSFIVFCLVLGVISGLAFFMVSIMGWAIGPIEVVCLVVFVGYAVTFSLHVAHDFSVARANDPVLLETETWAEQRARRKRSPQSGAAVESDSVDAESFVTREPLVGRRLRVARVRLAILHMGRALLSSATSTVGSSVFLLFCTLSIFVKLGSVVIAVSALSIFFALVTLPAALVVMGPEPGAFHRRCAASLWRQFQPLGARLRSLRGTPPGRTHSHSGGPIGSFRSWTRMRSESQPAGPGGVEGGCEEGSYEKPLVAPGCVSAGKGQGAAGGSGHFSSRLWGAAGRTAAPAGDGSKAQGLERDVGERAGSRWVAKNWFARLAPASRPRPPGLNS